MCSSDLTLPIFEEEDLLELIEDIPEKEVIQKTKRKKITREYINNADFCAALEKYKADCILAAEQGKPKPKIPNYIGECFVKLSEGLARRPNFFGYSYKDEMIVELCRDNGSDVQCVTTPRTQNSTIYQTQGTLEFKNRVNGGNNTIITLIQR